MQIYWSRGECNKAWQRKVSVSPGPSHKSGCTDPESTCTGHSCPALRLSWGFKLEQNTNPPPQPSWDAGQSRGGQQKAVKAVYANGLTWGLGLGPCEERPGVPFWAGTINKACNFSNLSREQWHKQLEDNENHPHKQVHYSASALCLGRCIYDHIGKSRDQFGKYSKGEQLKPEHNGRRQVRILCRGPSSIVPALFTSLLSAKCSSIVSG